MKGNPDNRAALRIIGSHLLQAAACGDTDAVQGHLLVYQAVLKAVNRQRKEAQPCL